MLQVLKGPLKSKTSKIRIEELYITPEQAGAWMERNAGNRKVSSLTVSKYARDMASESWKMTGDAIRFDEDYRLIDGQHRLLACIKSGRCFTSLVIYGLARESQDVMDGALTRRVVDVLTMRGHKNVWTTVAAARWLIWYRQTAEGSHVKAKLSNHEVLEMVGHHPKLWDSSQKVGKASGPSDTALTFVHYVVSTLLGRADAAEAFIDVFKTGIPSRPGCPAHALREYHIGTTGARHLVRESAAMLLIRIWNAWDAGETLKKMHIPANLIKFKGLPDRSVWVPDGILRSDVET